MLIFYHFSFTDCMIHSGTSPQVDDVSVTFVREVESRIIQDESGKYKSKASDV